MGLTADTWIFPIGPKFNNFPPYPQENHALFIMVALAQMVGVYFNKNV